MAEFLNMGGYAVYVWTSYGLTVVVLLINYILPLRRERQLLKKLGRLQAGKSGRHDESET